MKKIKYIAMALVAMGSLLSLGSCMDGGYGDPDYSDGKAPYGNNAIEETQVISIADLMSKYNSIISSSGYTQITDDVKIKGIVTGNDLGGNLYNEVSLQDETGALLVCINAGGLYGYLPVGQEVLVDLKGLYVGGYAMQAEVGGVYTNSKTGAQSIGKANRYVWEQHYKLIGTADKAKAENLVKTITDVKQLDLNKDAAKLVTLKNVKFKDADGTKVFAPSDGSVTLTSNCANRELQGINSSQLVVRTSSYAKFANAAMPTEAVDITGIFTRYRNVWQILVRTSDDIQPTK